MRHAAVSAVFGFAVLSTKGAGATSVLMGKGDPGRTGATLNEVGLKPSTVSQVHL